MAGPHYTPEQIRFVLDARNTHGLEYSRIAEAYAGKFGTERTVEQIRHLVRLHSRKPELAQLRAREAGDVSEVPAHAYAGFTRAAFGGISRSATTTRGRWFVTAASPVSSMSQTERVGDSATEYGTNLHTEFFDSIQTYCRVADAELVILPMQAHMPALQTQPSHYDPRLRAYRRYMSSEYIFNEHLRALDVYLNPQQVSPLTGLHRLRGGRRELVYSEDGVATVKRFNSSFLVAHAKQDLEVVATGNGTTPRILHSTGACTRPEYLRNRIGSLAAEGHVVGGLIVEVEDDRFWVRQVQAHPVDGSFCDFGMRYCSDGTVQPVRAEALRLGDLHVGRHSADVLVAWEDVAASTRPRRIFVEDVFDGGSVSHHKFGRGITTELDAPVFRSLEEELTACSLVLDAVHAEIVPADGKLLVVDSNHHDHLTKYLDEGRYLRDKPNYGLAHRMVVEMLDGVDPLRKRIDPDAKYEWLGAEEDYFVEGVQCAAHGHLGQNGGPGSPAALERVHAHSMSGHTHTPSIRGGAYVVGHSSRSRHGYNRGPSTWLKCCGLIWPGGQRQLITYIDGKTRLDADDVRVAADIEAAK